ncbi:MAG: hypothetical protein H3C34_20790, partial [Caldilineaceae bacterium]|nr:hypothetical protein [Caldilineaceae bacterium]
MYRTLGTIDRLLERIPFGSGLLSSLQAANLTFLDRVHLHDMRVHDRISGMEVDIAFLFQGEIAFPIPGFPALVVVLGAKDSAYTFLRGSIMIGEASVLILHDLSITMRLDTPLLRPAPIDASVPIVDHVEIQLYGEAVINSDFDIETTLAGFNLPPFSIGGTGLIVAAEDCMLDLSAEATPAAVTALGYGPEFKGVLGQRAHLYWLPQAVFDGVPGLRLDFEHIVIGHDGVSFHLVQTWQLHDNGKHILTSSELAGYLFDASWELGLHQIAATVQQNRPIQFVCTGKLRVPFLDALFDAGLGLRTNDDGYEVALSLAQAGDSALIDLGAGSLVARNLLINGEITDTGFTLEGSLGGAIDLAPLALNLNGATIRLEHEPDHDVLAVMLSELSLGPLGEVEKAVLRITSTVANGGTRQNTVLLETTIAWQDLSHRLKLDDLPEQFPLPPDDAQVTAYVSWEDNGAGGHRLVLRFTAALSDLGSSWTFIREEYRPQLRNVRFTFEANYADAVAFQSASTSDTFSGHVFVELELRPPALPDVPGAELFEVDREQWIKASLTTGVRTINGSDEGYMEMALADAPAVKINFPGLPQAEPPIQIEVKKVEFDLKSQGADSLAGQLSLEGEFLFRPINPAASMLPVPPAMAVQMEKLFKAVGQSDFGGTAKIDLRFKGDKAALELSVVFDQAKVELDLFDMMVGLTRGMALPQELNGSANRVDLDIDFDIQLREIRVHCGSIEDAGNQSQFGFELVLDSTFAGVQVEGFSFKLTGQEFSAGFSRLAVPITLPHFPVSQADLNMLRDDSGAWDYRKLWLRGERPQLAGSIALLKNEIEALKLQLGAATGGDEAPLSAGLRAKRKALFEKSARQFLIDSIFAVHQAVGQSNRGAYQAMVDAYMALMDATLHQFSFDTTLDFVLRDVRFVLPFQNPTDIRVEGGAQLVGFKPEDPLAPLGDLVFKLGLSAEYLYFNVEGGDPIPIPVFGQYQNDAGEDEAKVSIRLNHARIGYGYSKNALVVALAGELKIAKSLADDLNAAGTAGIGIRLPEHGRLGFKLDLIPITLGEVDFLLPLLDFTIDLRKEYSPGISDGARCEPYWDGLQLIAPNIIRYGFKRLSFAPFFGSLLAPNYNLSFDVTLGNGENGLTYVCNDYLVILSTSLYTIIPMLTDGTPFFNNLCTSIRLAGFGVSFNLQRPFPSMSPLALFEIFGLLADPNMPIDPDGALANMIRVRIQNARITLPPAVVRMFPEVGTVLSREIDYTANLGTLIALLQPIAGSMGRVAQH